MNIINSITLRLNAQKRYPFLLFELKALTQQVITRSRIFLRVFINEIKGKDPSSGLEHLSTRVTRLNRRSINATERSYSNSLLGRIIGKRVNHAVANYARRNLPRTANGLTLSLVGVSFIHRDNVPSLFDERDELEAIIRDIRIRFAGHRWNLEQVEKSKPIDINLENVNFGACIAKGCNAAVYEATIGDRIEDSIAIKLMFNYDAESNAQAIFKSMNKECLTFSGDFGPGIDNIVGKRTKLDYHPNIIEILSVFADMVPQLPDAEKFFPNALPRRLFEHGYGRNMTLFLAMRKYDATLREYLCDYQPPKQTSLILLAQLFDAVAHLVKNNIAHRDLKADNILLDLREGRRYPWLVITDFGMASTSLSVPFYSDELSRGGNQALMAPEILTAQPGPFTYLDYSASDLWACGAIGYEIMGEMNPFYKYKQRLEHLYSETYHEADLPDVKSSKTIDSLLKNILNHNPSSRPTAAQARSVCHLLLHSSRRSLNYLRSLCHQKESIKAEKLIPWLRGVCVTSFLNRTSVLDSRKLNPVETKLRLMFLSQINQQDLLYAVECLRVD